MSDALRDYGQRDETVCVKESEEIANEKRMMSILLCLVMAVGLLPTTALAAVVRDEEEMISYEPAEQGVYRMVCEFDGKLYFAGMGNPTATLVEVDPATNEVRIAYYNIRYTRGVSNGVHGLLVYDGEILMCLATDNYDGNKTPGGIIVASSDPGADLDSWRVIADQNDFDGLLAVMQVDGLNGGGIWDIIEYNGYLYVTVVTDKSIDGKINKQGFAMYRGEKKADGSFTWTQVVGENGTSGLGYGLGINIFHVLQHVGLQRIPVPRYLQRSYA